MEHLLAKLQWRFAVFGELVLLRLAARSVRQVAIGLSARLVSRAQVVSRGLDCRQQLQCRREQRRFLLVCGRAGAQDIGAITGFRSPWPIYPSLSPPLSSHIRISAPISCSLFSSVWKKPPSNFTGSGAPQSVEELWKEYFADPSKELTKES